MGYLNENGEEYLDESDAAPSAPSAPAPGSAFDPNRKTPASTDVTPDYGMGLLKDTGRAALGFGKAAYDMGSGLVKAAIPKSKEEAAFDSLTGGATKPMRMAYDAIRSIPVDKAKQHLHNVSNSMEYRNRLLLSMIRNPAARNLSTAGDVLNAVRNEHGEALSAGLSMIPGMASTLETGERATGNGDLAKGDPSAAGDLGFQLATVAASPEAGRFNTLAPVTAVARRGLGPLLSTPEARMRSIFPSGARADLAAETAIPSMLEEGVTAGSKKGLVSKLRSRLEAARSNLSGARQSAINNGRQVDLRPGVANLQDAVRARSPQGVNFAPEFNAAAGDVAGNLETLSRGGAGPTQAPGPWAPEGFAQAPPAAPAPMGPVPMSQALDAYDAIGPRISEASFTGGNVSPKAAALQMGRGEMASAIKAADPALAESMGKYHSAASGEELGSMLTDQDALKNAESNLTRRLGSAVAGGAAPALTGATISLAGGAALPATLGAAGVFGIQRLLASPAWKTVSSVAQYRVAKLLQSGQIGRAAIVAQEALKASGASDPNAQPGEGDQSQPQSSPSWSPNDVPLEERVMTAFKDDPRALQSALVQARGEAEGHTDPRLSGIDPAKLAELDRYSHGVIAGEDSGLRNLFGNAIIGTGYELGKAPASILGGQFTMNGSTSTPSLGNIRALLRGNMVGALRRRRTGGSVV